MADATSWWGAVTGTVGLSLSIYNAWKAQRDNTPRLMMKLSPNNDEFWFKATNNSGVPITISDAFLVTGNVMEPLWVILTDGENALPRTISRNEDHGIRLIRRILEAEIKSQVESYEQLKDGTLIPTFPKPLPLHFVMIDSMDNLYALQCPVGEDLKIPLVWGDIRGIKVPMIHDRLKGHEGAVQWSNIALRVDGHLANTI